MSEANPNELVVMPLQPIKDGRFVPNRIVEMLLDIAPTDMNKIACMDFTDQERTQFAQLIGYSIGGFSELSYVDDETYEAAVRAAGGESELHARNAAMSEQLEQIRKGLRAAAAAAFRIHPDDLRA